MMGRLSHPNIAHVYFWGEFQERLYLVTEFLEGRSLEDMIASGKTFTVGESLEIVLQLAQGLAYLHSNGIVHRDLKPGNIILTKGSVVSAHIIDFGMAYLKDFGEMPGIVGTLGYMSPEASGVLNRIVDERSDLYSLGVIIYRLVAGKMPFTFDTINDFYHHISKNPVSPRKLNIQVSEEIEKIILKLLLKDPDMRYQSAQGLIYDLVRAKEGEKGFIIGENDQKLKLTYQTRLLGRENELRKIKFHFNSAKKGKGGILFVRGESGIGKSRIVEECKEYFLESKANFFTGHFIDKQNKQPYKPFKDIVDQYVISTLRLPKEKLEKEKKRIKDFCGDLGEILVKFNSIMHRLIEEINPLVPLEHEKENQRFLMVLSSFFCQFIASDVPSVLYIDDFQWCDEGSIRLVEEILKNIKNTKLLIIGTYRDNEINKGHCLTNIIGNILNPDGPVSEITLEPFHVEDVNDFIAAILGEKHENTKKLSQYLYEKSAGNPFFIISILRGLITNRYISWQSGRWEKDWEKIVSIPYSQNVLEVILKNLDKIGDGDEEILYTSSVVGKELNIDILEKATSMERVEIIKRIDSLIKLQIIEVSGLNGKPCFCHDSIREFFYNKLDDRQRKHLHLLIAKILESSYRSQDEKTLFDIVYHAMKAQEEEFSLQFLIPAAKKLKETYACDEAFKYYQLAIRIVEKKGLAHTREWCELKESIAEVCLTIGENSQAIGFLEEVLPCIGDKLEKIRIYRNMGNAYFNMGDWPNCEKSISKALLMHGERLPKNIPATVLSISFEFLLRMIWLCINPIFHNFHSNKKAESNEQVVRCYFDLAWMYIFSDLWKYLRTTLRMHNITLKSHWVSREKANSLICDGAVHIAFSNMRKTIDYLVEAKDIKARIGDKWGVAQIIKIMALIHSIKGEHEKSLDNLEKAKTMFETMGDLSELSNVLLLIGNEYYYTANYAMSLQYYESYTRHSQNMKNSFGIINGYTGVANCYTQMGDFKKSKEYMDKAFSVENKNETALHNALLYKAYLEMERNNCEEAVMLLENTKDILLNFKYVKEVTVIWYAFLIEAYLKIFESQYGQVSNRSRKLKEIRAICSEALKDSKNWVNRYGIILYVTGGIYCLTGYYKKSEKMFIKSAEILKKIGMKYEFGKCYYQYAKLLKLTGREKEHKEMLLRAYDIFDRIGALNWKEKSRKALDLERSLPNDAYATCAKDVENLKYKVKLNHVVDTARYLSAILDHEELLKKILESSMGVLGACRGALLLYPENRLGHMEVKVIKNSSEETDGTEWFHLSQSILSEVENKKEAVLFREAFSEDILKESHSVFIQEVKSVLCAPIMNQGEMLGAIYMDNNLVSGIFEEEDRKILELIASQAGVSIRNALLYRNLRDSMYQLENSRNEIGKLNESLEKKVAERTKALEKANDELKHYALTVEELAVAAERNRVAIEMHDTMGHTMALMVTTLEAGKAVFNSKPEKALSSVEEALKIARLGFKEMRASIHGLIPSHRREKNLIKDLEKLFKNAEASGMKVDFNIEGNYLSSHEVFYHMIYRTCQEALTNSIKHGNAKNASIILVFTNTEVKLYIFDDGKGCKNIKKGMGLTGMTQRVEKSGGMIRYGSDGESGFHLCIELPVKISNKCGNQITESRKS